MWPARTRAVAGERGSSSRAGWKRSDSTAERPEAEVLGERRARPVTSGGPGRNGRASA